MARAGGTRPRSALLQPVAPGRSAAHPLHRLCGRAVPGQLLLQKISARSNTCSSPSFALINPALSDLNALHQWMYYSLLREVWWAADYMIFYGIIPMLFIRFSSKTLSLTTAGAGTIPPAFNQIRLPIDSHHGIISAPATAATLPTTTCFIASVPQRLRLADVEICYVTQFIFLEFFFRGFLLNALRPAIGANAVWFMVLPYLMIHFSKPWLEATGAIFFGLFSAS